MANQIDMNAQNDLMASFEAEMLWFLLRKTTGQSLILEHGSRWSWHLALILSASSLLLVTMLHEPAKSGWWKECSAKGNEWTKCKQFRHRICLFSVFVCKGNTTYRVTDRAYTSYRWALALNKIPQFLRRTIVAVVMTYEPTIDNCT